MSPGGYLQPPAPPPVVCSKVGMLAAKQPEKGEMEHAKVNH